MVGVIVTGHGRFADGLTSAIELIAGPQQNYVAVNFEHEVDELTEDLTKGLSCLKECEGVIIFTDLVGGSPFKTAALLAAQTEHVEIIAGTNLPMLAEVVLARTFGMDLETLANVALNTGKDQVSRLDLSTLVASVEEENDDFSDGI